MLKNLWRLLVAALAIVGVLALSTAVWFMSGGISARPEPGAMESAVAGRLRVLAIPRAARSRTNPIASTPETIRSGMRHFADHCAVCHANNGNGDTVVGRGLYPRAPDMRKASTQALSDGELFYIIENGVRLTGMPAWGSGTAESEQASWKLVHFIRHLPAVTAEELSEMEHLNPKGPEERVDPEEFLKGTEKPARPRPPHRHPGGAHD